MNIKIHVKVNERERKKELFPFSCNCLFNQWSFLQKKTKQHKTIFIKKKYMYNVMLHFFFWKKIKRTRTYTQNCACSSAGKQCRAGLIVPSSRTPTHLSYSLTDSRTTQLSPFAISWNFVSSATWAPAPYI